MRCLVAAIFLLLATLRVTAAPNDAREEWVGPIEQAESKLRAQIKSANGLQDVYALLTQGTWGGLGQRFLLVFNDRVILHCEDGKGRTRERELTKDELAKLRTWILNNKVEQLPKFDEGTADGIQYEYFHLRRDGDEHRVFMNNPPTAPIGAAAAFFGGKPAPHRKLYGELTQRMLKLDQAPMRVIYPALENLPDFRVINPKEKNEVVSLAFRDNQVLAGVSRANDKPIEWHRVTDAGLAKEFTMERTEVTATINTYETDKGFEVHEGLLKGARLQAEFANMAGRKDGLWIYRKGKKPELIAEGIFGRPVLCPGEWLVAAKTPPGEMWNVPNGVVRIHLTDKKLFNVDLPLADTFDPVAWIGAHKKVLLYQQRDWQDWKAGPEKPEFYLLDPASGATEKVQGEFRPFFDAGKHQLQPTGRPNEVWAAVHSSVVDPELRTTTIGQFDTYNFRFTGLLEFPDMHFDSSSFFVGESVHRVWLAVNGDVLQMRVPRQRKGE